MNNIIFISLFLALLLGTTGMLCAVPESNTAGSATITSYDPNAPIKTNANTAREIKARYAQTGSLSFYEQQTLNEFQARTTNIDMVDPPGSRFTYTAYPQNANYWTGTTTDVEKTQASLVKGVAIEAGWFIFDISGIPAGSIINSVQFNGYVNSTHWPYWSLTPLSVDPRTAYPYYLYSDIDAEATDGNYLFRAELPDFTGGWQQYLLNGLAISDLQAALAQGWFAMGMAESDYYSGYYIYFDGWNEPNRPYLTINYSSSTYPWAEGFEAGFEKLINATGNTPDWTLNTDIFSEGVQSAHNASEISSVNILASDSSFDLSGSVAPILSFDQIAKTEANYDHCYVEISTDDGLSWTVLPQSSYLGAGSYALPLNNDPEGPCFTESSYTTWQSGTAVTPDNSWWKTETFSLSEYQASSTVKIRFRLKSDYSYQYYGWLIDNVKVKDTPSYSFTLTVPANSWALIGGSHAYSITINNTGADQDIFTPSITGGGFWTYGLYQADGSSLLTAPLSIEGGGSAIFVVKATVPDTGVNPGDTDTQNFSVTSTLGMDVQNFSLTTTAIVSIPGDVIDNAWIIPSLPYTTTGTTNGYYHNYGPYGLANNLVNLVNPVINYYPEYTLGNSPDIVYQLTLTEPTLLSIDLLGSQFDTALALVTAPGTAPGDVILINDDYYYAPEYPVSYVSYVDSGCNYVLAGTYFIIIGGYGGDSGEYTLTVTAAAPPMAPAITIAADTIMNQVILSWTPNTGMSYNIYSDTDPFGSFTTVVATGINDAPYSIYPIPTVNTFYRVTEKFCFPDSRSSVVIDKLRAKSKQ